MPPNQSSMGFELYNIPVCKCPTLLKGTLKPTPQYNTKNDFFFTIYLKQPGSRFSGPLEIGGFYANLSGHFRCTVLKRN